MTTKLIFWTALLPFVHCVTLDLNGISSTTERQPNLGQHLLKDHDKITKDYSYSYGVSDPNTGDHKTHFEKRENGVVTGAYSYLEPDGSTRLVQYRADGTGYHPVVQKLSPSAQNVASLYPGSTPNTYYNTKQLFQANPSSTAFYPNNGYNYNRRYIPQTLGFDDINRGRAGSYFDGYNRGIGGYNRGFGGYNRGFDGYDRGLDFGSYNLDRNRYRGQSVPLLHSSYHGYDNLYH